MDTNEYLRTSAAQNVIREQLLSKGKDQAGVPIDYECATLVTSLTDLSNAEFSDKSAIVLPRKIEGDFEGLARRMSADIYSGKLKGTLQSDWQKSVRIADSWLGVETVRAYAADIDAYSRELVTIIEDMEFLESLGRTPLLKVYSYDYDDDTVDRPHADPYTPNYSTGEKYDDRYITVYNQKVTRHAKHQDAEANASLDEIKTYRLKPGASVGTFNNCDIWRQACGINKKAKPFIHWSGTEIGDDPKLILTA